MNKYPAREWHTDDDTGPGQVSRSSLLCLQCFSSPSILLPYLRLAAPLCPTHIASLSISRSTDISLARGVPLT